MRKNCLRILVIIALSLLPLFQSQLCFAETDAVTPTTHMAASLVLGQPGFTTNAAASTQTGMRTPYRVAVDPTTGKVFVADLINHRVLRFAALSTLSNGLAAEGVLGQPDFLSNLSNRGGTPAPNSLFTPMGVSVDPQGRLWVADTLNNRILRFDNAALKANGADADGVLGQPDFNSAGAATTQSGMTQPSLAVADAGGRLWVADTFNNRILCFDNASAKANGADADSVLGQTDFNTNVTATTQNGMNLPFGAFLDSSGRLWVADFGNSRVLRFDDAANKADGADADGVLGQANFDTIEPVCAQNRMINPRGISLDPDGRLYVADSLNNRILVFEAAAGLADGAAASLVLGQSNFTTCTFNTGGLNEYSLNSPSGVFFDPALSVLWVVDSANQRVLMYGNTAEMATLVLGQPDFTSNASTLSQSGINTPYDVTVDSTSGKVFVAEQGNNRVVRFASVSALSNGAPAEAVFGQADFISGQPNRGGPVAANTMFQPFGVAVDQAGRLWVADVSNNRVLRFDHAASKASGADADGVLGQPDFTNNADVITQNGMSGPYGVFVEPDGRLWVADYHNNRVLRFEAAASKDDGANADGVLGQADFTHADVATTPSGMWGPAGLYVDPYSRLWVAERDNNRLLRFDEAAAKLDGATADGVLGQADFLTNTAACAQNRMNHPRGVSGDLNGRLYVADGNNHRVLVFENAAELPDGSNASSLLGQFNFNQCTVNTGGVSAASLNTPTRVFFDTTANVLWVADWLNNRVLMYGDPTFTLFMPALAK
jgi:DNA-binding beta-propeller fold protein YncE